MRVLPQRATLPPTPVMAASVRWTLSTTLRPGPGWISPVSRSRASCWRAISPTAIERRTSRVSVEPSSASWVAVRLTAASRSSASARSRQPVTWTVPAVSTRSVSTSKRRPSAARLRRSAASAGSWRARASSTSRPIWAHEHVPAAGASARSTSAAAAFGRQRVCSATRIARHTGTRPVTTCSQSRGQAVAQLEGLADVGLAGVGGQAQRGGVLHQRELRHQRSPRAGDRQRAVAEQADLVGGPLPVGFDGVLDRPVDGELEAFDLDVGGRVAVGAQRTEEGLGGGRRCFGHGSIAAPATDSRAPKSGLCTGVGESSWVKFSRSTAGVLSCPRWLRCERSEPRNHPCRGRVGFVARAWRPSHLNQCPGRGCFSAYGVSLRSAPGGLPTRPTSDPVVEVRAKRATKPPAARRPGFVARAWRPSHLNQRLGCGCFSAYGVSLRSAPGGLPTRPTSDPVVEVRAKRATKPPLAAGVGFVARA